MTFIFGMAILVAIFSMGRDGRMLPPQGLAAALGVAAGAHGWVALGAIIVLLTGNIAAWAGLRRFAPVERGHRGVATALTVAAGLSLMALLSLAAAPGLPLLVGVGLVIFGLCGASQSVPLLQFVGMMSAVNGLFFVAGVMESAWLLGAAVIAWAALALLGLWLMPRLAWHRADPLVESFDDG